MMAIQRKSAVSRQTLYRRRAHARTCRHAAGDGLHHYHYDSQGRLQSARTGQGEDAPTTRYAHNALGQRVFKTEPLYATASGKGAPTDSLLDDEQPDPGLLQTLLDFFTRLWSPAKSDAEHLGWAYLYDEEGSLLGEYGMGGAASAGQSQFLYLPTAQGPIPMAAEIDSRLYAIHTDHLGTPRRLTQADGQAAWQWAYTPYGDEAPTLGAKRFTNETTNPTTGSTNIAPVRFNLRYPGQYFDEESGLHYNYFRSYDPRTGRYTQSDPIGLDGGWNRFAYVGGNPLLYIDPEGLRRTHNGHYTPNKPRPRFPNPRLPQPSYDQGDPWQDAAGYFDDEGRFLCLRWRCKGNATCYPDTYDSRGQYRSANDFVPPATDPSDPPEGCVCDAPRFKLKGEPNFWDWKDYLDTLGKTRQRFRIK